MNKNKKIILLIGIIAIILLVLGIIFTLGKLGKPKQNNPTQVNNLTATEETIENCKLTDDDICVMSGLMAYKIYEYKANIEDVQNLLKQLNLLTLERKANEQEDLMTNYSECSAVYDKFYYRNMTSNYISYYEDVERDVISITNEITHKDFCTGEERIEYDVYSYSKKLKDFIVSEEDMFNSFEVSKEQVNQMIEDYAKKENIEVDVNKITSYQLLYNNYGQLIIDYKFDGDSTWRRALNI